MKIVIILFFCMIFDMNAIFGQQILPKTNTVKDFAKQYFSSSEAIFPRIVLKEMVSPNFYSKNLSFFCRQEIKWEKVTGLPLKFRLGSVEVCDRLEGKKIAGILPAIHGY